MRFDDSAQGAGVFVLYVAAVAAQVNRDAVRASQIGDHCRRNNARFISAPRLPQRRDVVDVDVKSNHFISQKLDYTTGTDNRLPATGKR